MTVAARFTDTLQVPILRKAHQYNDSPLVKISPSLFLADAIDACLNLVNKSSVSEPHFIWEDLHSAAVAPSEYELHALENDFESIEYDELIYRDFCSKALDRLHAFSLLDHGWDGGEALPAAEESIYSAYYFLRALSAGLEHCIEPKAVIDDEGIPTLIFDNNRKYCSVSFYENEEFTLYCIDRVTNQNFARDFSILDSSAMHDALGIIKNIE